MKEVFYFDKKTGDLAGVYDKCRNKLRDFLFNCAEDFQVEIFEIKKSKTHAQLRGFHRLVHILVPYFKEWSGEIWTEDSVKDFIKSRAGFMTRFKGVMIPKSCANATLEEMTALIKETEVFGAEMDVKNCHLESREWLELEKYYQQQIMDK